MAHQHSVYVTIALLCLISTAPITLFLLLKVQSGDSNLETCLDSFQNLLKIVKDKLVGAGKYGAANNPVSTKKPDTEKHTILSLSIKLLFEWRETHSQGSDMGNIGVDLKSKIDAMLLRKMGLRTWLNTHFHCIYFSKLKLNIDVA